MELSAPNLSLTPRLDTRPGLRLLSYLALLPASLVEVDAAVERALAENPYLERRDWRRCALCGLATADEYCPACRAAHWDTASRTSDPAAVSDWRADLLTDALLESPAELGPAIHLLVATLDDHGLLPDSPDLPPGILDAALARIRLVGAPGIGASSPLDCVRVQAHALVADGEAPELLQVLARDWLPEVAEEAYDVIASGSGTDESEVRRCVEVLRQRTRPFVVLSGSTLRSAPVDVVFTVAEPGALPRAHVAGVEATGLALVPPELTELTGSAEARAWMAPHRDAAQRLLAALGARNHMLQRVADELARTQAGFIVDGAAAHVPLRRCDLARTLAVHPSTVGRAVTAKVARCPDGRVLALSDFFGRDTSLREQVASMCAAHPDATDRQLAQLLADHGVLVARRTVAKYRALAAKSASPHR